MNVLLNTLYVSQQGCYLHLDHETIRIELEGQTIKRVPLRHLGGVVIFGNVMFSPMLAEKLLAEGRGLVLLTRSGRFAGRLYGPVSGNVLLRRAQHEALDDPARTLLVARGFTAGKLQNARQLLMRSARESTSPTGNAALKAAAATHAEMLKLLESARSLDEVRGLEGTAARAYFEVLNECLKSPEPEFQLDKRQRRPPRDRMNALLSFLYTLLRGDCASALEAVGLDPQVGYLHALRSGRPALALDLMEELRPVLADRLALTLVNRSQLSPADFEEQAGGAIWLNDGGRRTVIVAYQKRKQQEVQHPGLQQRLPYGLLPQAQARLLARHLRGDIAIYPPYLWR
jgi:CRISPR-associated protein Cas1